MRLFDDWAMRRHRYPRDHGNSVYIYPSLLVLFPSKYISFIMDKLQGLADKLTGSTTQEGGQAGHTVSNRYSLS